ncbi:hypothetical protein AU468_07585 [Alkalispirochaeta sphaeroplastigenens]|uniref:6-hydroxymethylpterin diphosphokinase MptE-like domain-containing protein n=1 Tax=Alkalispirochaeta sphaeroplastigenens TaxID=1187066 RepID=A0A2S4JQI6_9SPIO|nr:6-hydroxymethylpterin diphosphokinase MptE-like protein [Alkalispirochaeta sphaeroplastigenens]POR01808.1 hypothetical protein AU468_07585 [Alkalispirochaeta sphaeroplastigenens]
MTILSRNLAALEQIHPDLARGVRNAQPSRELTTFTTRDGHTSFRLTGDHGERSLHSSYAPMREAEKIVARLSALSSGKAPPATLIILGLGGGFLVRAGLEALPGTTLIVVERSHGVLRTILEGTDLSREILTGRLFLALTPREAAATLEAVHLPAIRDGVQTIPLQAWTEAPGNREHFRSCLEAIRRTLQALGQDGATISSFSRRWLSHTLHNSYRFSSPASPPTPLGRLRERTRGNLASVLAAGPGLDSWLEKLDRPPLAPLIATDTALPALLQRGILPTAVVVLDPQAWSLLHLRSVLPDQTWLLADAGVAPGLTRAVPGERLVWYCGNHPLHHLLRQAGASLRLLPRPPESVTEAAVLLAPALGAARVEVIGSDGGFPRGTTYARGTYHYSLAHRRACRLFPEEHFFGCRVYPDHSLSSHTPSPASQAIPFFTTPAMANRRERIARALEIVPREIASREASPPPERSPVPQEPFNPQAFWELHLRELHQARQRLRALGREDQLPAQVILQALGYHGRAHLPLLLRRQGVPCGQSPPPRGTWIAGKLEEIGAFILEESNRYSLMR